MQIVIKGEVEHSGWDGTQPKETETILIFFTRKKI
jgi:hypothetical protein